MQHKEFEEPLAGEFRRTFDEHNLGMPLDSALQKLSQRLPIIDVQFFVSAVMLQKRTGGNLAELLDKLAYVIRERFKLRGRIRAVSAHGARQRDPERDLSDTADAAGRKTRQYDIAGHFEGRKCALGDHRTPAARMFRDPVIQLQLVLGRRRNSDRRAHQRRQKAGVKSTSTENSSRRPISMANVQTQISNASRFPYVVAGPTPFRPGPVLLMQAMTAERAVPAWAAP